jgi:hypothetical protein
VPNKATVVGSTTCVHDQVPTLCYNPSTEGTEKVVTGIVGAKSTLTVTVVSWRGRDDVREARRGA